MIKEKPVLKRMTLFVIGESISLKKIFIKSLLKDHQSQNESLLAFYYGVISDSQKTEFPFRIFDIDLFEYSNFFEQFPMFESFDEAEMGFIYTYNTEDDDKSINILADFLQKLNVLFSSQQKVEKMTKEEQNFRNNYGKKIDFFIVGISKNQHSRSKKHEFLSKKFSFKHYFFSEAENESSNQIKNEIIAKISQIIVIRNKTALIEEKNNLIKEKLEEESSEAAGKILALSKFYGCNNQENSWNRERLTLGFPNDVLWNEFKPLIIEKREKYWKFYSEMHQQNLPWRIRKKNFIAKNFYDCFEFYSSLSKDFIEVFSQIIITNYLTQDGNLHISDGNLKLMMGLPEQKEFEEVEAILKQKTNEKFLTYKKNFEKIYEFEKNYELKNKFTSNFKFYSEFDLFDQEHFCISIIRDFAIESINSNEKKLEIPLTDGDLKIMAGAPIEEEFISIKKTLNFQLSQREKKFFSYPDFPRVQLSKSFSFFSEFGDDLIIEFSRLIVIQFLKAKVLSNQNFSLELSLKDGDIKIMSGHSNENEMKSLKIAIQNEVDKKTSYFLKNSQNQTNLKKNNKKLRINYQHSEFDDFELKFFVKEIASLKFSKRKNFTRGDIKLLLGHAPNEEVEKTFRLILSQMEE